MLESHSFDNLMAWTLRSAKRTALSCCPGGFRRFVGPFEHVYSQIYDKPLLNLKNVPLTLRRRQA